jgi:hypothetical protein
MIFWWCNLLPRSIEPFAVLFLLLIGVLVAIGVHIWRGP